MKVRKAVRYEKQSEKTVHIVKFGHFLLYIAMKDTDQMMYVSHVSQPEVHF